LSGAGGIDGVVHIIVDEVWCHCSSYCHSHHTLSFSSTIVMIITITIITIITITTTIIIITINTVVKGA
jgi:hypothetical protein